MHSSIHNPPPPSTTIPQYWAKISINGAGNPTVVELLNTLPGTIVWAKHLTGIIRGTPSIGLLPDINKAYFDGRAVPSTGLPSVQNFVTYEIVNAPRVFQMTCCKLDLTVPNITVVDFVAQGWDFIIGIAP